MQSNNPVALSAALHNHCPGRRDTETAEDGRMLSVCLSIPSQESGGVRAAAAHGNTPS